MVSSFILNAMVIGTSLLQSSVDAFSTPTRIGCSRSRPVATTPTEGPRKRRSITSSISAGKDGSFYEKPKPSEIAEFEVQELKIQLNAMVEQDVVCTNLQPEKYKELEQYVERIVQRRPSMIPLAQLNRSQVLPGTSWKLIFSTQSLLLSSLPVDTVIGIDFVTENVLNYSLNFGKKVFGLNKLTAKSSYTIDDVSFPMNFRSM